jgi:hypothetical protein
MIVIHSLIRNSVALLTLFTIAASSYGADNGWLAGFCDSGTGVYRWNDGNRYEGQCRSNFFEGQGVL